MTTLLLIRHGETDASGKCLSGWTPGWHLNALGRQQVRHLAENLAAQPLRAVYTSPLERTVETAAAIAAAHRLSPVVSEDLGEMRFGGWEGQSFDALDRLDDWKRFNSVRGFVRPPGGELMIETQARMVRRLDCIRQRHAGHTVAVVSHADPIRSALAFYLDIPLQSLLKFEISPASVSVVDLREWGPLVRAVNQTGAMLA